MNPDAEIFYPEYLKDLSKNKTISLTTSDAKISHFENSGQILPYLVEDEFKHLNLSSGVLDSSNVPNCRVCDEVRDLDVNWFHYLDKMVADHEAILRWEKYNFQECRIPVLFHLNIEFFKFMLSDYADADICTLLEYGFSIGYENLETTYTGRHVNNHKGALENSHHVDKYLIKEISKKAVLGPFHSNPFSHEIVISPLNSVSKKGSDDRLTSAAHICQRVTNAVSYMYRLLGFDIVNYLDDFAGVESPSRAKKAFDELKHLLDSCGLEESSHRAIPPSTRMAFLGVICDTDKLVLEIPDDKLRYTSHFALLD